MAKTKAKAVKARKTVKAVVAAKARVSRAQPKDVFRQPIEMLQNGFNSVMGYFK